MRTFRLTSPEMRGQDIHDLQHRLNERLAHYKSRKRLKGDGIYGRDTAHCVAEIAFLLGLQHYDGTPAVVRLIEHPTLRNPGELVLAHHRQKQREEATAHSRSVGAHGLQTIVANAQRYIGVHENPAGSNWGEPHPAEWEKHFGFSSGVSWCGCFAGSMVLLAGGHVSSRVAFCPYIEADARARTDGFDLWRPNHSEGVGPGWLALFNWSGGSEPEHVEIVKELHADHLTAIGGNTGGRNPSNGGEVAEEQRPYGLVVGYARPRL